MDLVFKMHQGGHHQLRGTKPVSLRDPVKSLQDGPLTLYIMLQREKAGPEQVIDQEHLRQELPPEEHWPDCGVSGKNADHLPLRWVRPISITSRIGLRYLQAQRGRYVRCLEHSWAIVDSEPELERTRRSPGCHRMIEL